MNRLKRLLFLLLVGLVLVVANGCQGEAEQQRQMAEAARDSAAVALAMADDARADAERQRQLAEATIDSLSAALARCQAEE